MSGHSIQTQPTKQGAESVAESGTRRVGPSHGVGNRHEGTADSLHVQAAAEPGPAATSRRARAQSGRTVHGGQGWGEDFQCFYIHNKVIAKDFALQIVLFTLVYSEKVDLDM